MFLGTKASELRDVDGFSLVERNQALSAKVVYKSNFYWDFEVFVRSWGIITFEQKTEGFLMDGNCFPTKL